MDVTNYFEFSRFWLLLKMESYKSRKALFLAIVISLGMHFIGNGIELSIKDTKTFDNHSSDFSFFLIIAGFILSSLSFNDLSNNLRRYNYLSLPASVFEKFLCMLILTTLGWIIVFALSYTIYSGIANLIGSLILSTVTFKSFNLLDNISINTIKCYIVLQSVFLVGATQFKGYVFPKTLFALLLFALLSGLIAYLAIAELLPFDDDLADNNPMENTTIHKMWDVLVWMFWLLFAPLCWLISYLGLKEQEA